MSKVILVTGSNSSIGYELVRLLAEQGHIVYLGARNEISGKEAEATLHQKGLKNVKFIQIDVTVLDSIERAKCTIDENHGKLDVLVNNAAISRADASAQSASIVSVDIVREVYNTNVFGLIQTTTTFMPLLRKSLLPIILNVSSGLGSSTLQSRPGARANFVAYQSSKAAVNSYTVSLAQELREAGFKVNAVTPGLVSSKLNNFIAGGKSLEEGAKALLPYALLDADGPTGKFFNWEGQEVPW
ncbi:Short-chain dehydrogenase [Psilocybe cubensis]|uniref:Short-chain dehydrogenase n=2 Tax=Psilocybe cubensis TaxID=181762 RepID=A0ACB8GXU3_PSICU|nr:Short-chain dehydrogenase [Psilocybe cubensis]KAH9480262.1 Short-chain dehydrogenase [Psilocybe cubensis]